MLDPESPFYKSMSAMGMTHDEITLMGLTVQLWNGLVELPKQHADDIHEARAKVHEIQRILMVRPAQRYMREHMKPETPNDGQDPTPDSEPTG